MEKPVRGGSVAGDRVRVSLLFCYVDKLCFRRRQQSRPLGLFARLLRDDRCVLCAACGSGLGFWSVTTVAVDGGCASFCGCGRVVVIVVAVDHVPCRLRM